MNIEIRNVSKRFGAFEALKSIDLTIEAGSLVALLGPSGSGKTTLLRIIAGLEEADRMEESAILFDGVNMIGTPVGQRGIGFVFQHYALFRHLTVFENIAFGLRVQPRHIRPTRPAIRERVRELLALIQLEGIQDRYPWQLSGGQRQRVALARSLAVGPRILLLDEPFGALDARVRADLRRWLRRLHDELHVTSVLVTHDQEEALEVADRIVVINQGRIEQTGPPEEVFHHPASPFVMGFLGHVNRFSGRMDGDRTILTQEGAGDGADPAGMAVYVRPHELTILRHPPIAPVGSVLRAEVLRVRAAGPVVRIELRAEGAQHILVELPHCQHQSAPVSPGDQVYLQPAVARCFQSDCQAPDAEPAPHASPVSGDSS